MSYFDCGPKRKEKYLQNKYNKHFVLWLMTQVWLPRPLGNHTKQVIQYSYSEKII